MIQSIILTFKLKLLVPLNKTSKFNKHMIYFDLCIKRLSLQLNFYKKFSMITYIITLFAETHISATIQENSN